MRQHPIQKYSLLSADTGRFKLIGYHCEYGLNLEYRYCRIHVRFVQTLKFKTAPEWLVPGVSYEITRDWNLN